MSETFKLVKLLDPINNTIITGGLVPKGAYNALTNYTVGDSVDYNGSSYVQYVDAPAGTLPTDTTYWQVLANKGNTGTTGATGATGPGVPTGGSTGQVLAKINGTDYNTQWVTGGTGAVDSVNGQTGVVVLDTDDVSDSGATNKYVTAAEKTKLSNLSGTNTGDQTITLTGDVTGSGTGSFATAIGTGVIVNADINASAAIDATKISGGSVSSTEFDYLDGVTSAIQTQIDNKVTKNSNITGATKTKITYDAKGLVTAGADATQDDIGDGTTYKQYSATEKTKLAGIATGATVYTDEMAQDATGAMVDTSLTYVDATPLLQRAALTGDVTAAAGSNTTAIASGVIINADVNASAAIALSKLAATTTGRALVSDGSGFVSPATTTATEIGYVNGVTSAIQTQLNAKGDVVGPASSTALNLPLFSGTTGKLLAASNVYQDGSGFIGLGITSPGKNLDVLNEMRVSNPFYPKIHLNASSNATDIKKWQIYNDPDGHLRFTSLNDAENAVASVFTMLNSNVFNAGGFYAGTAYTAANGYLNGVLGGDIYWDNTQWVNPSYAGNNGWGTMAINISGDIKFVSDGGISGSPRTYTEAQFLAKSKMVVAGTGNVGIGVDPPTSKLQVNGSLSLPIITVTANTTLDATHYTVLVDASGGNRTITLPPIAGCQGRIYNISKIDSSINTVTVDGDASETIMALGPATTTQVISTQGTNLQIQACPSFWKAL